MLDFVKKIIDQDILTFDKNADRGCLTYNLFAYVKATILDNSNIFRMGGRITHVFIEDEQDVELALLCVDDDLRVFVNKDIRKDFDYLKGSIHHADQKLIVFVTEYGDAIAGSY